MNKFAFIIHPLSIQDVTKKYKMADKVPPRLVARLIKRKRPYVQSEITGVESKTGAKAIGWFVVVPLLPWQILELDEDYVVDKIAKGCKVAEKRGAKIVGLGAFTALVGDNGRRIAEKSNIAVTTGNTYTIATAIEGTIKAAEIMGIELSKAKLAVVGATGSIGMVCAKMLAPKVSKTILIGRSEQRLRQSMEKIKAGLSHLDIQITTDVSDVSQADLVITVTSAVDVVIHPEHIKSGAVVCDVARPRDVSPRVAEARNDVLVIDGSVVEVPGNVNFNLDFGLPPKMAEACIAETMILALDGRYEDFTLGKELSVDKVQEIDSLAKKHGFKLSGFRRFEKPISEQEITRIKENAEARLSE
jgi:predicted amino acid dehydrogenase